MAVNAGPQTRPLGGAWVDPGGSNELGGLPLDDATADLWYQYTSGAITPTGALANVTNKALDGSAGTPAGALAKVVNKVLAGGLTPTGALTTDYIPAGGTTYDQGVAGTIAPAGALTKLTSKTMTGGMTPAGTLTKGTIYARTLSGAFN